MPDTAKRAEYRYATIDDRAGAGAHLLDALQAGGVNLVAFHAFPVSVGRTQVDLFAEDSKKLAAAAQQAGITLSAGKSAFLLEGGDRPGVMAEWLGKLASANVNVTAAEAVRSGEGRYGGIVWVKPADYDKAAQALGAR